jgi:hypothetical protein
MYSASTPEKSNNALSNVTNRNALIRKAKFRSTKHKRKDQFVAERNLQS